MDKEKARKIYTHRKSVPDAKYYPEIEAVFFEDNDFFPALKIDLIGSYRSFYISTDDRFYFSPSYFNNKKFEIFDCKKITDASLVQVGSTSDALTGLLIAGAAGAVVGAGNKAHNYAVRVDLDDQNTPVVFGLMYIAPVKQNDSAYANLVSQATKIVNKLKEKSLCHLTPQSTREPIL